MMLCEVTFVINDEFYVVRWTPLFFEQAMTVIKWYLADDIISYNDAVWIYAAMRDVQYEATS